MPKARTTESPLASEGVVPPGAPSWITSELIAHTIRVWQPYYCDSLTTQDAVNMLIGVSRLMEVLSRS